MLGVLLFACAGVTGVIIMLEHNATCSSALFPVG
jgi:hypothetical protein